MWSSGINCLYFFSGWRKKTSNGWLNEMHTLVLRSHVNTTFSRFCINISATPQIKENDNFLLMYFISKYDARNYQSNLFKVFLRHICIFTAREWMYLRIAFWLKILGLVQRRCIRIIPFCYWHGYILYDWVAPNRNPASIQIRFLL